MFLSPTPLELIIHPFTRTCPFACTHTERVRTLPYNLHKPHLSKYYISAFIRNEWVSCTPPPLFIAVRGVWGVGVGEKWGCLLFTCFSSLSPSWPHWYGGHQLCSLGEARVRFSSLPLDCRDHGKSKHRLKSKCLPYHFFVKGPILIEVICM